jgi:hypothetical protein
MPLLTVAALSASAALAGPPTGAGMRAHVDPQTGARVAAPPAAPAAASPSLSRSAAGLVEVPHPSGGFVVDLQGRFRSAVRATVQPDGTVTTDCTRDSHPAAGR